MNTSELKIGDLVVFKTEKKRRFLINFDMTGDESYHVTDSTTVCEVVDQRSPSLLYIVQVYWVGKKIFSSWIFVDELVKVSK